MINDQNKTEREENEDGVKEWEYTTLPSLEVNRVGDHSYPQPFNRD